jgi:NAD(P)-dependent dehydrogenase (short-subunit alcohol dehydrogenase family)
MKPGRHSKGDGPLAVAITGASSGIGRATAEEFARQNCWVAVLARRRDLLDELVAGLRAKYPEARFLALRCDVSRWDDVVAAATAIEREFGRLNVLVNNAGAFEYQSLEKSTIEKIDEMIDVNVRGVIYTTKAMLGLLSAAARSGQRAKIVNVSSISGLWGFSKMSVYTATKFAITGFSSAMRRELQREGIGMASIHPGPVRSKPAAAPAPPKKWSTMLPDEVARQIHALAISGRGRRISHPAFQLLHWLEHLSPRAVDRLLRKIL